jgi:transposase
MIRLRNYIFIEERGMTEQGHKRLIDEQVKMILDRFIRKELQSEQAMDLLGLKRSQFFEWVKKYRESGERFTIQYHRQGKTRGIRPEVEGKILQELKAEKALIENPTLPIWFYNYSYLRDQLRKKYQYKVSLPTIIDRAKKTIFTSLDLNGRCMIMKY